MAGAVVAKDVVVDVPVEHPLAVDAVVRRGEVEDVLSAGDVRAAVAAGGGLGGVVPELGAAVEAAVGSSRAALRVGGVLLW